jgi:hypothetical protein
VKNGPSLGGYGAAAMNTVLTASMTQLPAAGQPDHWVAVDVHRAAVDLGAQERVDEQEPYTDDARKQPSTTLAASPLTTRKETTMITHDPGWSLPHGITLVPSRWQATAWGSLPQRSTRPAPRSRKRYTAWCGRVACLFSVRPSAKETCIGK